MQNAQRRTPNAEHRTDIGALSFVVSFSGANADNENPNEFLGLVYAFGEIRAAEALC
jgi:hypothetical protein